MKDKTAVFPTPRASHQRLRARLALRFFARKAKGRPSGRPPFVSPLVRRRGASDDELSGPMGSDAEEEAPGGRPSRVTRKRFSAIQPAIDSLSTARAAFTDSGSSG